MERDPKGIPAVFRRNLNLCRLVFVVRRKLEESEQHEAAGRMTRYVYGHRAPYRDRQRARLAVLSEAGSGDLVFPTLGQCTAGGSNPI